MCSRKPAEFQYVIRNFRSIALKTLGLSERVAPHATAEQGGQEPPGEQNAQKVLAATLDIETGCQGRAQGAERRDQKPRSDPDLA